ncbi:MAG: glutathione S-transferase family protein [Neomegalonema sp.]|nr:glutathione S-transferase family protein [Neomegalonema sp.]
MKLHLVSHKTCPYVQRAIISLLERGVEFERTTIDLANKPDWFLKISPLGRVPVLIVDGTPIFESAVIAEFLEETLPSPLHPADPLERAHHRAWIEFGGSLMIDNYIMSTTKERTEFDARKTALIEKLGRFEAEIQNKPFFSGERFALIDASLAPLFRSFVIPDQIDGMDLLAGYPKLAAWREALIARPSVQKAVDEDYLEAYTNILHDRAGVLSQMLKAA